MSLGQHLIELRKRLFRAAIAIVLCMVVGWFLSDFVWDALREPIFTIAEQQNREAELNYADITGAFDLKLQISLIIGFVLSAPFWLYQVWAFLSPGLKRNEKRYAIAFLAAAVPLFFAGCYAGWIVFPNIVNLMTGFAPAEDAARLNARQYFDFALRLIIVVGVAFVLPVLLVLLNFVGVLTAKSIIKSWRVAILVIVLFTAMATPAADVLSMLFLAIPMILLYLLAAGIAYLHDRRLAKKQKGLLADYDLTDPA
ncbi:twin-arginine translocase subunit TatC [Lysinibacter cavernae]|uniref:Sec-independent protein translocase protein TatC n=1 Tax=Lysinibacter cavernae TaxID=1640652 RepID=A0A7X5QZR7_9MICO|nr:twin-arginine translocase subunit TatC [Lysinibacter cavernae]NIH52787.1 sec-independent protein translocase protein TatC [Lysinibacter cavernae]